MKKLCILILLLFCGVIGNPTGQVAAYDSPVSNDLIRVAIQKGLDTVTLDGDGILATTETGKAVVLAFPALITIEHGRVSFGSGSSRLLRISGAGLLRVNGKTYRGVIELVPQGNKLLVVNELPLEQYLVGVINSEISSTWPMEAIKVQAVIARTYAVAKRKERSKALYHLESTVMDQAYEGSDEEDSRAVRGVHETEGEVLTYHGTIIQAFYHANCGGSTESSENVWGRTLPYLQGVQCQYCQTSSTSSWEQNIALAKLEAGLRAAGQKVSDLQDIKPGPRNNRGRLKTVLLVTSHGSIAMPATKFRMAIGSTVIKSTNFSVRVEGSNALFKGVGYGHGVGLCQYGAKQRALDGFSYAEILNYYYPGTRLVKLSELK